jgi:hypothetical protein
MGRTSIRNVKLDEVSFVGKGDNPEAHIILLKKKPEVHPLHKESKDTPVDNLLKQWFETGFRLEKDALTFQQIQDNREIKDKVWGMVWTLEDSISSIMCDDDVADKAAMIQQSVDEFKAAITPITKGEQDMNVELKKAQDDLAAAQVELTKAQEEMATLKAACASKDEEAEKLKTQMKKEEGEDPIYKGLPEAVVAIMKSDRERISKMEDENLNREYISKAAAVEHVGSAVEIGPLLKTIAKFDTATADKVFDLLKTADARIKEGDLLKEHGKEDVEAGNTPLAKLNKKATDYKAAHPEVSFEKAFTIVFDAPENDDLRKQYSNESRAK